MKEAKRSTVNLTGQQFKTKTSSDTTYRRDREKELQVENRGGALSHSAAQFVSTPYASSQTPVYSLKARFAFATKQCACQ
jgi:hypothetical protein